MKKNNMPDFRREAQTLIKTIGLSDVDLASKLRTTVRSVYRWRTGISSPQLTHIENLRALASSTGLIPPQIPPIEKPPPSTEDKIWDAINMIQGQIADIKGRLTQLGIQVTEATENIGYVRRRTHERLDDGEKKISELLERIDLIREEVNQVAHSASRKTQNT